jgi:SNF2 family DNA or RNA helicase
VPKYFDYDVTPELQDFAWKYAESYTGNFPFMLDMKVKVQSGSNLSNKQYAAILNCAVKANVPIPQPTPVVELDDIDLEFQSLVKNFEITADEPAQVEDSIATDPKLLAELSRITKEMETLNRNIDIAKAVVSTHKKEETELLDEEKALFEEFQAKTQALRNHRLEVTNAMSAAQAQAMKIERDLENLRNLHALTLQQIAAEEKFDAIKKQLEELREDQIWSEFIRPFQWDDVCFMAAAYLDGKNGVLNANDMGLGKTFESGALESILIQIFIAAEKRHPRVLWLTKKSLRNSTFRELQRWSPDRLRIVLDGNASTREFQVEVAVMNNAMLIANYDALNTTPSIMNVEWDFIFMDEVHKVKGGASSKPTQVFLNTKEVCDKAKFIVPMSGSPIQNHPKEMWSYLHIFDKKRFPDVRSFERSYCYGYGERDEDGNPLVKVDWERIIRAMSDRVIRHSKKEVLADLPDKVREFRYVELDGQQAEIYNSLRDEFFAWLDEQKSVSLTATSILAQLTRLRQIAIVPSSVTYSDKSDKKVHVDCTQSAKIDEAMDIVEQLLAENEQVVVFSSQFNEPLFEMQRRVSKEFGVTCEVITGANSQDLSNIEQRFQSGETRILLANAKTAGEGLNLQKSDQWEGGANHAIFLDLWWNPKFNEQCEDRLHRQGQKDAVTIHIIQADNTVDAFIAAKLEEKEEMIEGIMESETLRSAGDWKNYLTGLL